LQDLSDEICGGRLLATLEGGYDLNGLRDGVMAVLWEMSGTSILDDETTRAFKNTHIDNQDGMFASILKQTRNIAKNYWTL
ncbi:MAG: histone deacetylase, partial [Desulfobulbaceae bacterium]|nr:histone deacetylase [Desulfobulbaceae bacterium]